MNIDIEAPVATPMRTRKATRVHIVALNKRDLLRLCKAFAYLAPAMILFVAFTYAPFVKTVLYSFSLTNNMGRIVGFEGLANFADMLTSRSFYQSLWLTVKFVPMAVIPTLVLSFGLVLLVQKRTRSAPLIGVLFSMPIAVSTVCASMLFLALIDPAVGVFSHIFGVEIRWLVDKRFTMYAIAMITIWQSLGFNFIFMIAGLQNIPVEHYESAAIDGARWWRVVWHITLPGMSPTIFFLIVTGVIGALQTFGPINLLTSGGPENSTMVLSYAIYRQAFFNFRYDAASAQALVFFIIILGVTLMQFRMEKRSVFYS